MLEVLQINLLIFDLDGTILDSTQATFLSIMRSYQKLGLECSLTADQVSGLMGLPSEQFYQAVTPAGSSVPWQFLRRKVREEYAEALCDCGKLFPHVSHTLNELKKRGYRLALVSNSGRLWFEKAVKTFELNNFFEVMECADVSGLSKIEIVKQICLKLNCPAAAMIGDRLGDVEAAHANNLLSVGARYGYGGTETAQADFVLSAFSQLLDIFNPNTIAFEPVWQAIQSRQPISRPYVIAINGIDLSGKTEFTNRLAFYLQARQARVSVIHIDDFHQPRAFRNSGADPLENYWNRNIDIDLLVRTLLGPLCTDGMVKVDLTLLDVLTDRYETQRHFDIKKNDIVLLEGIFLFREELAPFLDYKIFIDISFVESRRRAFQRDVPLYGEDIIQRYENKYWPAQARYLRNYHPQLTADLVIDNNDYQRPLIARLS
jgi:phosphoglycolate phosphatase-like HAD superfamily hydrolase/uridine kinase